MTTVPATATIEARVGVYANFAQVTHDADGFTFDFYALEPGEPYDTQAILVARVRMGHRMTQKFAEALLDNIAKWVPKELKQRDHEAEQLKALAKETDITGDDQDD